MIQDRFTTPNNNLCFICPVPSLEFLDLLTGFSYVYVRTGAPLGLTRLDPLDYSLGKHFGPWRSQAPSRSPPLGRGTNSFVQDSLQPKKGSIGLFSPTRPHPSNPNFCIMTASVNHMCRECSSWLCPR